MKLIVSASALSVVSSLAFAQNTAADPAAAASTPAPATEVKAPAAAPEVKAPAAVNNKFSMRVQLDPFFKNLNNATNNYKIPKLDALRIKFERSVGDVSKADVELRLNELENSKKYAGSDGKFLANSDVVKYFRLLFKVPGVKDLEIGYVREMEPALYGYTDKVMGSNIVEAVSFTGHMNRVEGYRAAYNTGWSDLKLTYHLARHPILDSNTVGNSKPNGSTWYHKLTSDLKVADVPVQLGLGMQGKWLDLQEGLKLKRNAFVHLSGEQKLDDLKIKAGVAYDSYATIKKSSDKTLKGQAANDVATTYLLATKYDLLPKEFTLLGEFNLRTLKSANEDRTSFSGNNETKVSTATETAFTLAGQYMLDEKLSLIPSYTRYSSSRAQALVDNANGAAFGADRTKLKGSDGKAAGTEQTLGLRIRYDY